MAILTLHNRYHEKFVGMFDGQVYEIGPHKDVPFPDYIARHLQKQSVFKDNPITGEILYSLGIVEAGDDLAPIEEKPVDPFDRSDTDWPKSKVIPSTVNRIPRAPREGSGQSGVTTKER